jgi:hypothetical protein
MGIEPTALSLRRQFGVFYFNDLMMFGHKLAT